MKKYFNKIFYLASLFLVVMIIIKSVDGGVIDSIKVEAIRYQNLNLNYLWIFGLFLISSYFIGWFFSKSSRG